MAQPTAQEAPSGQPEGEGTITNQPPEPAVPSNVEFTRGNILHDPADAICNPVNLVGAMGRGLALEAAQQWPQYLYDYQRALRSGALREGRVSHYQRPDGRYVLHAATKRHWRNPSPIELVRRTIDAIGPHCEAHDIGSVAVPPLGCGLGGLQWTEVRPLLIAAARRHRGTRWIILRRRARSVTATGNRSSRRTPDRSRGAATEAAGLPGRKRPVMGRAVHGPLGRRPGAAGTDTVRYELYVVPRPGHGQQRKRTLKAVIGPGDDSEPVLTIMLPEED